MAMQICILSDERLDSIAEWQEAINAEGFPLRLSDADPNRNLVAYLRDEETSIEYDIHDFSELKNAYRHVNFGRNWRYAVAFTWSSDFAEEIAAWMAATAYARATNGVIFDEQEGKTFTPEESLKIARDIEHRRPGLEAVLRNYMGQLSAKSPEAEATLRTFIQSRLGRSRQV
jgi:hypothetical protein